MDIKEEHNEFFHELDGRGFIFQNKNWLGGCFEDDQLQVVWEMWQAAKAEAVPEWISVKNSLPPENTLVLGMSQTPCNILNTYNVMALDEFEEADITHWMPLPGAPQEPTND